MVERSKSTKVNAMQIEPGEVFDKPRHIKSASNGKKPDISFNQSICPSNLEETRVKKSKRSKSTDISTKCMKVEKSVHELTCQKDDSEYLAIKIEKLVHKWAGHSDNAMPQGRSNL